MKRVKILSGYYRVMGQATDVSGREFGLVQGYREDASGGYVQVHAEGWDDLPAKNIRVRVPRAESVEVIGAEDPAGPAVKQSVIEETDEAIIERLRVRFDQLDQMTRAVKQGHVRAMIVSGPPGVGKSHGVEAVLARYDTVSALGGDPKYDVVKGAMSALGLYVKLYQFRNRDNVLVFDDCDSVFADELALNILKAALDSKKRRTIHWNTDSRKLNDEGVPNSFEFQGSAIFITNLKFDRARGKIREHLAALESRCHYMDLTIDTAREKMLRIRQIASDGMLKEYGFSPEVEAQLIDFVDLNQARLRELSLRTVIKLADLAKAFPDHWQSFAQNTLMR